MIPLTLYFKGPYLKVEIAVAQGKKMYDKRRQKEEGADEPRDRPRNEEPPED